MQADALVPVPVHATRKKTRGFNQAEILARVIGKKLGIPVIPEMLVRNKKTLPQKDLSAAERLKNLSGAFAAGRSRRDQECDPCGRHLYNGQYH